MSKKRRVFDIDMPEEETFPAGKVEAKLETKSTFRLKPKRRGPMASAITENAESLKDRAATEAQIRAENDQLAHEYVQRKVDGLIIELLPLDAIVTDKLARDRLAGIDDELAELVTSISEIGLSNPIRVQKAVGGRYELIQGFRRLQAYKALKDSEGGGDRYATIPAVVVADDEALEVLYRKMVDENLVRKDISFAEMAMLALKYAQDAHTDCNDPEKAVTILFKSVGYQKRSYIRGFVGLMDKIGGSIKFPADISRALGLELRKQLDADATLAQKLVMDLAAAGAGRLVEEEAEILRRAAGLDVVVKPTRAKGQGAKTPRQPKTVFTIARPEGVVKCIATAGRLEVRVAKDFSTVDRRKLEQAIQKLLIEIE
ncbi:MAG: replication protein [Rhodobacteraceae bacterium]|nr:MAG: replication protein [Paracoccaceae bacterium]